MARDEFIRDVRRAMLELTPRVDADSPFTNASYIEKMLRGADLWLTPKTVEAFNPADFHDLDATLKDDLARAVEDFRGIAVTVDSREPTRPEQREAAVGPFTRVVRIVQGLVFQDWLSASQGLLSDAERWAREEGWPTRRYPRDVTEDFLGNYQLDRLVYAADGAQLALIPLGRFAPGTEGMFDLAVLPDYDSMMVVRERGRWFIHPLPGEEARDLWSREAFVRKSHELARLS